MNPFIFEWQKIEYHLANTKNTQRNSDSTRNVKEKPAAHLLFVITQEIYRFMRCKSFFKFSTKVFEMKEEKCKVAFPHLQVAFTVNRIAEDADTIIHFS